MNVRMCGMVTKGAVLPSRPTDIIKKAGGKSQEVCWRAVLSIALMAVLFAPSVLGDTISMPVMQYGIGSTSSNVAYSPDGTKFLAGYTDGVIRLWDIATLSIVRSFSGHSSSVTTVAFSADGSKIISCGGESKARVWSVTSGLQVRTLSGHSYGVTAVCFSPDGTVAVTGSGGLLPGTLTRYGEARLYEVATGRLIRILSGHAGIVWSVACSPDGTKVLTGSQDGTAMLWDLATGTLLRTFTGHTSYVNVAVFSPDGSRILTGSSDDTGRLWDLSTGGIIRTFGNDHTVSSAAFSPDGASVLFGLQCIDRSVSPSSWGEARLWDVASGTRTRTFSGHARYVNSVCFSPDGARVVIGAEGRNAILYETATGAAIKTLDVANDCGGPVAVSSDGSRILAGSALLDTATGAQLGTFSGGPGSLLSVALSGDCGKVLIGSGGYDWPTETHYGEARLWNVATGTLLRTFTGHTGPVNAVAFSPDGSKVVTGAGVGDGTASVWNTATGARICTLSSGADEVYAAVFSPDGTKVLTGDTSRSWLWSATTGALIRSFSTSYCHSAAFSPDGTKAILGLESGYADIINVSTGSTIRSIENNYPSGPVKSVGFSPNGTTVIIDQAYPRIWEVATGDLLRSFVSTGSGPWAVFSPDGTKVFTGGDTARAWPVTGGSIKIPVPDVEGFGLPEAQNTVVEAGLVVGEIEWQFCQGVAAGSVICQSPAAAEKVPAGSPVVLVVCMEPISGSIVINNNRSATNSALVSLNLTWAGGASSGVSRMRFSDNGSTWSPWESLRSTRSYTLPGGDSHKTVRVQFIDKLNNRSDVFSDYIRLDTTLPTGSILINGGASTTSNPVVTLSLGWTDGTGSGVTRMRFSDNGSTWTAWMIPKTSRSHTLPSVNGYHTVRVQYLDGANNYSAVFKDYIKLQIP